MIDVFPARLRYVRERAKLQQKDIAEQCNISPAAYSLYESGKREPSFECVVRLAQICHVSTDFLFGLSASAALQGDETDSFGDRLKLIREERRLSLKDVAQKFGLTHTAVYRYEQGLREPPVDFIRGFCRLYQVSSDFLFGLSDTQSIPAQNPYSGLSPDHRAALDTLANVFHEQESRPSPNLSTKKAPPEGGA